MSNIQGYVERLDMGQMSNPSLAWNYFKIISYFKINVDDDDCCTILLYNIVQRYCTILYNDTVQYCTTFLLLLLYSILQCRFFSANIRPSEGRPIQKVSLRALLERFNPSRTSPSRPSPSPASTGVLIN